MRYSEMRWDGMKNFCRKLFDMVTFMMMVSGRHNTGSCGDVNLVHGSPQGGSADIVPVPITTLSAWP